MGTPGKKAPRISRSMIEIYLLVLKPGLVKLRGASARCNLNPNWPITTIAFLSGSAAIPDFDLEILVVHTSMN